MISKLEASFIEKIIGHTVDNKIKWKVYNPKKDSDFNTMPLIDGYKSYSTDTIYYEERVMDTKTKTLVTKKRKCVFRVDHSPKHIKLICWFIGEYFDLSVFSIESIDDKTFEYKILDRLFTIIEDSNTKKENADKISNITSFISNFK